MKCKIFDWKSKINEQELKEVINILNNDGVIIYPTDTVYGIACNCFSKKALEKIFLFKERDFSKPINVLVDDLEKINRVAESINEQELDLINKYMPGAVTIILKKKETVLDILTSNLDTVGVRIPDNAIALKILSQVNYPLATTSVNLSGSTPGIIIEDFLEEFIDKVDIIIDGGKSALGIASTIIQVDNNEVKILRQGTVKI